MKRDLKFDVARCLCMFWVIGLLHLTQYLGDSHYLLNTVWGENLTYVALGVFSLISGYFIGKKYVIETWAEAKLFYKKRLVRFYPLFVISSLLLVLIGFNSLKGTLISFLGITAFTPFRVSTTWYMAMLIILYGVTPLVSRKRLSGLFGGGIFMLLIMLCVIVYYILHGMDFRFVYNMAMYFGGIILSRKDSEFQTVLKSSGGQITAIVLFVAILIVSIIHSSKLLSIVVWPLGVYAILSFSSFVAEKVQNAKFGRIVEIASYATLSYYLFHRLFYYLAINVGLQTESYIILYLYLFIVVFPLGWIFSYWIQRGYDAIMRIINC